MMRLALSTILILICSLPALGGDGFTRSVPGYEFEFPRDHGSHPDFRTEWWYFTGNVENDQGRRFGFKLTFFRSAMVPPGQGIEELSPLASNQLHIAHFAISDFQSRKHRVWERMGRPGLGQAGASTERMSVFLGDWTLEMDNEGTMHLRAIVDDAGIDMTFKPTKPFVIHGKDGAHQKSDLEGHASHYISYTRLATTGTLKWDGTEHPITGYSWMDHEFGSDQLGGDHVGWDWFSIQLEDGRDIMVYQLRKRDGTANPVALGGLVHEDGTLEPLGAGTYSIEHTGTWTSPRSGAVYPMGWKITFPDHDGAVIVKPVFEDQEMDTMRYTGTYYWEGAVTIEGTFGGEPVSGRGYVELVGYSGDFTLL
ncbi:MAG: carotenoid 1,2-hydratase [Candidatus Sumerlaeia bacterium]|nr:carotenoid 1,2-hydratase [Candidatus Sumerlaeia bacterium]